MFKKSLLMLVLAGSFVSSAETIAFQFDKPIQVPLNPSAENAGLASGSEPTVTVLRVRLTDTEKQALAARPATAAASLTAAKLPASVNLGMNGTPVLDQGRHGSCVTFATTAALDAVLGKGDYISQLCNLELGTHLEKYGYTFSGWDGSYGPVVLDQLMHFGMVSKKNEQISSCAGVIAYPKNNANDVGNEMTLAEFKTKSEDLTNVLYWQHLYSNDQLFDWQTADKNQMQKILLNVKRELAKGNRLTFGTFLIIQPTGCSVGACASHNARNDTWALTKEYDRPPYDVGGHEMVIFGYDDNAVATENDGTRHKGLLMLRNSWSDKAGDNGNYYMTYDYFVKYANEVQSIVKLTS